MAEWIQETKAHFIRWVIHLKREPFSVAFSLLNPVVLLIFMGGAFQSLARTSIGQDYRAYLLPGILSLTVLGNSLSGGISLLFDKENGFLSRVMSTPTSRASILMGRFLAVNVSTMLQCLMMLGLGFLLGVPIATGARGVLGLLGIGLLLSFGVTIISLTLAFVLTNHGDFFAILGITVLPAGFLSSAFVPLESLSPWMRLAAQINPMTYAVDGMRSLILSGGDGPALLRMALVLVAFDCVALWLGIRVFRRQLA
jgi:ABC-2 type transport system permease protein